MRPAVQNGTRMGRGFNSESEDKVYCRRRYRKVNTDPLVLQTHPTLLHHKNCLQFQCQVLFKFSRKRQAHLWDSLRSVILCRLIFNILSMGTRHISACPQTSGHLEMPTARQCQPLQQEVNGTVNWTDLRRCMPCSIKLAAIRLPPSEGTHAHRRCMHTSNLRYTQRHPFSQAPL